MLLRLVGALLLLAFFAGGVAVGPRPAAAGPVAAGRVGSARTANPAAGKAELDALIRTLEDDRPAPGCSHA
jgi:hypothetical protein